MMNTQMIGLTHNSLPLAPVDVDQLKARLESAIEQNERQREEKTPLETKRAHARDLVYFWSWCRVSVGIAQPCYPVAAEVVYLFISEHLTGLPELAEHALVAAKLKKPGNRSIASISRYIASLSWAHEQNGHSAEKNPCRHGKVVALLRDSRAGHKKTKKAALTRDVLQQLLEQCGDDAIGIRDRAMLLFGFASGGRRREEIANALLVDLTPVTGGYIYFLPGSKTRHTGEKPVLNGAGQALKAWLEFAGLQPGGAGPIFRQITTKGELTDKPVTGKLVNRVVKKLAKRAGLANWESFGAHSLRSGFVTECGRQGKARHDAMALTGHKSGRVFDDYYQAGNVLHNDAADLF